MNWKTAQDTDRQEDLLIFVGLEESAESVFETDRLNRRGISSSSLVTKVPTWPAPQWMKYE